MPDPILKRKKFPFQAPGMSSMIKQPSETDFLSDDLIRKYGVFDLDQIHAMKKMYADPDFKLMGAYEIDYLLIAMTSTILMERYNMSI